MFIDAVALVANEKTNTHFCFNNSKLMAGNTPADRYIVYYNLDSGIYFFRLTESGKLIAEGKLLITE